MATEKQETETTDLQVIPETEGEFARMIRPILAPLEEEGYTVNQLTRRRLTLIAMGEAIILGQSYYSKEFWKQEGLPNVRTFEEWKKEPVFNNALEQVRVAAIQFSQEYALERVELGLIQLQNYVPALVEKLIHLAMEGNNEFARLQAIDSALNRATELAGPRQKKGESQVTNQIQNALIKIYGPGDPADKPGKENEGEIVDAEFDE